MIAYRSTRLESSDTSGESYGITVDGQVITGICSNMFAGNTTFNLNVHIGNSVNNCAYMFYGCNNLNQNIYIPNSVNDCAYMFSRCNNLNQNIYIPNSVNNCAYMFSRCNNMCNISIGGSYRNINTYAIVGAYDPSDTHNRKNLFFNVALNNKFNITNNNSICRNNVTWKTMTNGFYNATYNIYCYYNYPG